MFNLFCDFHGPFKGTFPTPWSENILVYYFLEVCCSACHFYGYSESRIEFHMCCYQFVKSLMFYSGHPSMDILLSQLGL